LLKCEVCEFNKYGDMRLCRNWDTGMKHRDKQDSNGNWNVIAED